MKGWFVWENVEYFVSRFRGGNPTGGSFELVIWKRGLLDDVSFNFLGWARPPHIISANKIPAPCKLILKMSTQKQKDGEGKINLNSTELSNDVEGKNRLARDSISIEEAFCGPRG